MSGGTGKNHGKISHVSLFPAPEKTNEKTKRKQRKQIERKEKRQ
jgi:hypothetical protein